MGYIAHDAVIVVTSDYRTGGLPGMDAFRASMPERFRRLVIGPITTPVNNYTVYTFLPDGSKEGWGDSDLGNELRDQFRALFQDTADDAVAVRFGGDFGVECGPTVTDINADD